MESHTRLSTSNVDYHFVQWVEKLGVENIRFVPSEKLSFPATDMLEIQNNMITLGFLGLYGVDSPLPHYFHTYLDEVFQDFLNMFNHRLYQLFYLSFKKTYKHYTDYLIALSGRQLNESDKNIFASAGLLGRRIKTRAGLKAILRNYLNNIAVTITSFVPAWIAISPELEIRLGENSVLGQRVLDLNASIGIEIGPLSIRQFFKYYQDCYLFQLISRYCPLKIKICFLIKNKGVPVSYGRLGLTSRVGQFTDAVIRYPIVID